jgi:glycosyltransferase involved in cell wall biosynthesis
MNEKPLVSIIIATKNEEKNIPFLLKSISKQTYENLEVIVVDNNSTDQTKEISSQHGALVFNQGPERSSQRNFGVEQAKGDYLLFLDADMALSENVVEKCVATALNSKYIGVIIPEESRGKGFWARCIILERSFYIGVDGIEAARFFDKNTFKNSGGYDSELISGEDWDLHTRISKLGQIGRISALIYHNEGHPTFLGLLRKKIYYAKHFSKYLSKNNGETAVFAQTSLLNRYRIWFSNPQKLFRYPVLGLGMLFLKTCEFGVGGIVFLWSKYVGK